MDAPSVGGASHWTSFVPTSCGTEEEQEEDKGSVFGVGFETAFWFGEEDKETEEIVEDVDVDDVEEGEEGSRDWRLWPWPLAASSSVLFDIVVAVASPLFARVQDDRFTDGRGRAPVGSDQRVS